MLVENLQAEICNLRDQVSSVRRTAPKELSLIFLITKWFGTEKSIIVKEFFCVIGVISHNRKVDSN